MVRELVGMAARHLLAGNWFYRNRFFSRFVPGGHGGVHLRVDGALTDCGQALVCSASRVFRSRQPPEETPMISLLQLWLPIRDAGR